MRIDYFSDAAYIEEQAAKYRTCVINEYYN